MAPTPTIGNANCTAATESHRRITSPPGPPKTIGDEDAIAFWHPHLKRSARDQNGIESIRKAVALMTSCGEVA